MAPESPSQESAGSPLQDSAQDDTLAQIRQELAMISEHMLTKANTGGLLQEFWAAIKEEISTLHADLSAVEVRVESIETEAQASCMPHQAAELATTQQGNLLLSLWHQVEDLENQNHRQNIRIRGLLEPDMAPLTETLRALFQQILGWECPEEIQFDQIHWELEPQQPDGMPRDILCFPHAYTMKERLMAAARGSASITFQGVKVALYQNLSGLDGLSGP
ncbi:Hypothetical predicted protein [Pelobates cultripes]|uniref:Uncharacterized protein n=1 Tax=Pelobates cultripes TaxID=61616 RepID=A0AAD1TET9_PELCU|nr:Hypothetical predicted protein [Pelobates cultripes]